MVWRGRPSPAAIRKGDKYGDDDKSSGHRLAHGRADEILYFPVSMAVYFWFTGIVSYIWSLIDSRLGG